MDGLPAWLEPLTDAAEQRALDTWAIERRGLDGGLLMERAGTALALAVAERVPHGTIAVVCGKGNNGGDGLVAARILRDRGRDARVLTVGGPPEPGGDARANLERLPGEPPRPFAGDELTGCAGIVDAILGTGTTGAPRGPAGEAISAVASRAEAGTFVVACDVPSGVDASTGEIAGASVRARLTVTFHAAKPGLWINPGKAQAGEVRVIDIGIPPGGPAAPQVGLITAEVLAEVPVRSADSTKFAAGSVLVCGGSTGLTGAPCLTCEAAMRAGAGYVTACVPASLNLVFEQRLLEVMSAPLPDHEGAIAPEAAGEVLTRAGRVGSIVLGPGLGRAPGTSRFARTVAAAAEVPLLLDADGLNAHAGELAGLAERPAPTVLTPHAGELARLLGGESGEIAAHRLACARRAAAAAAAVVVLKGDDTIIAAPGGRVGISPGASPALATAGTGDVLSGVIGAFLAKGMDPFTAACAGVTLHAAAGRRAAVEQGGVEGVVASDVIAALPRSRGG